MRKTRADASFEITLREERGSIPRFEDDLTEEERRYVGVIQSDYQGALDTTRLTKPDGMTYNWKRVSYAGQADEGYFAYERSKGWLPVPLDRHKDEFPGLDGPLIEHKGLILCERSEKVCKFEEQLNSRKTQQRLDTVPTDGLSGDATIPVFNHSTAAQFGSYRTS
jgi:hypothetical protein